MGFTFQDLDASQAADINQALAQVTGLGFVEGGEPREGARPFAVAVREATTYIDGDEIVTPATSVDLTEYSTVDEPRKLIVYIAVADAESGAGEFRVAAGEPATPKPQGRLRFSTYEPTPPDFRDLPGVPVAEVWIGANAQHIVDEDIRDRRLNATLGAHLATANTIDTETIIDGSGAEKRELVDIDEVYTTAELREAINTDTDHGSTAPHTYFSGDHADLTDVQPDQHHPPYTDTDARLAVEGSVDLADLTAGPETTPGYHLERGGAAPEWANPPMAEAPVLQSGTLTHSGGSETQVTVSGITPSQRPQFELGLAIGVDTAPSWSADYAYSVETSYRWNDSASEIEAELTLSWDTDPGAGNDLTLGYAIYEMDPDIVTAYYDDAAAVAALTDEDIAPGALAISSEFSPPTYAAPSDAPNPTVGDVIAATDPDTGIYGEFLYDGSTWTGPYAAGVTALSNLDVDVAKDWAGYRLVDIGSPAAPGDLIRPTEIDEHATGSETHHTKTTSSEIDHAGLPAGTITADQHHARYTDQEATAATTGFNLTRSITASEIPDGSETRTHAAVGEFEQLSLRQAWVMDARGESPFGLTIQLNDLETDDLIYAQQERLAEGTAADPLTTIRGPAQLDISVRNYTGERLGASGGVAYRIEETEYAYGDTVDMFADTSDLRKTARQGVVVTPSTELVGFEVTPSDRVQGATRAYIQEPNDGAIRASADISGLDAGESVELIADTPLAADETVYVSLDAEGAEYTRGRYNSASQFPYTAEQFAVERGVFTASGHTSGENRYNIRYLRAIYE